MCEYVSCRVLCVCVDVVVRVLRVCVVYVLRVCVVCAFCVLVLWCIVVCVVCGVCGAAWHAEKPVCRFKTSPCVGSKRFSVCQQTRSHVVQHARVLPVHTEAF